MPGFDGRGPRGFGQGRGLGPCQNRPSRRGAGFWNPRNFFKRNVSNPWSNNSEEQRKILERELLEIEEEKNLITKKIEELKKG